jgi:DNA ligase 1
MMLLAELVETSRRIAATTKRIEKTDLLAALLRQTHGQEVGIAVAYLSGSIRQGRIGLGWATIQAAAAPPANDPSITIQDVDRVLEHLAGTRGKGAENQKRELLHGLLGRASEAEQQFLRALLLGELRQGALEGVMLDALAKASGVACERVRRAVMMAGDPAAVAVAVLEQGEAGLAPFDVQLFQPVQPMLAQTAETVAEALGDLGEAALEYKFDGARVQIHRSGDQVAVYSRQLNEVTPAVPEIVEAVRSLPGRDLILDGEVLSLMPDGRPQPFQVTMRRFGRRLNVEGMRSELPLSPFWFDLLYLDGGSLLDEPQSRRFAALRQLAPGALVPHTVTGDPARAEEFLRGALERGHEGVMAKALGASYAAGARGQSWLKIKQPRTLDLVILAAEWGNGRRKGWLSNLHLGARDTAKGGFAMLGKTFKGLTDEMLKWQTQELLKLEISRDSYTVYVQPKIVVEIAFNEIQISSRYPSGLALRFARVKSYRGDKSPDQADTFETVQRLAGILSTPSP